MSTWAIDAAHSEVQFKIKHLMINTVTGEFTSFKGEVVSETDDFSEAHIKFEADVNSINTKVEMRDNHLKSDDFFNAEKYPTLSFVSKEFRKLPNGEYSLVGDLTIRDITKPVTLDVDFGGTATDFYGNAKAGFELKGKINRKDFGLMWNGVTEAGEIVVSDDVRLYMNVQLQKTI